MRPGSDTSKVRVVILTDKYRIKCSLSTLSGIRLTDYIRSESTFIAITCAEVSCISTDSIILRTDFMDINKDHIQIITLDEMISSQ